MTRNRRLPDGGAFPPDSVLLWQDPTLTDALNEWASSVVDIRGLDPLVDESVRLRCAYHHDCHT